MLHGIGHPHNHAYCLCLLYSAHAWFYIMTNKEGMSTSSKVIVQLNFRLAGTNFYTTEQKKIGRHISLKMYEPGGTNLKNLQYKKIFVDKNRKCAKLPILSVVSIGQRKWPAGTKNKTIETLKRIRIGIFRMLTSHIQWHKLELVSC